MQTDLASLRYSRTWNEIPVLSVYVCGLVGLRRRLGFGPTWHMLTHSENTTRHWQYLKYGNNGNSNSLLKMLTWQSEVWIV